MKIFVVREIKSTRNFIHVRVTCVADEYILFYFSKISSRVDIPEELFQIVTLHPHEVLNNQDERSLEEKGYGLLLSIHRIILRQHY